MAKNKMCFRWVRPDSRNGTPTCLKPFSWDPCPPGVNPDTCEVVPDKCKPKIIKVKGHAFQYIAPGGHKKWSKFYKCTIIIEKGD